MPFAYNPLALVNNQISYDDVYSDVNSSPSPRTPVMNTPALPEQVVDKPAQSSPLTFWFVVLGLFVGLIVLARYASQGDEFGSNFKQIKPSAYNLIFLALAVGLVLPLLKIVAAKIPNASLRNYLLSI